MDSIIEVKNVNKIYTGAVDTQVLYDINLSFAGGTCNSIIGESGSGKSTLLNIMGTLDKPSEGEVIIDGVRTNGLNKNKLAELRNETIGFVFQFHYLLPEFTALENVLMPYRIKNRGTPKEIMGKADELFEMLTLSQTGKLDRPIMVLLYGSSYWNEIVNFRAFVKHGMISEEDLALFRVVDDPRDALKQLQAVVSGKVKPGTPGFARSVTCNRSGAAHHDAAPRSNDGQ